MNKELMNIVEMCLNTSQNIFIYKDKDKKIYEIKTIIGDNDEI